MTSPWVPLPDDHPLGGLRPVLDRADAELGHEPADGFEDRCWILHTVRDADGRRLRWREILAAAGRRLEDWPHPPSYLLFEGIPGTDEHDGPSDGEIDHETLVRLVELLAQHSAAGPDTPCHAVHAGIERADGPLPARLGRLADAPAHHATLSANFPANWWAVDGSWFVLTDWDLCATEVFGSARLIAALLADEELEAVRHPSIAEALARP
ncbi:hypothetical protein ABZ135_20970 [Streptomyces sp. NPDC006339]|uniref:hypothetical protein n=1 Tax=Streptomyces sp. NPDC006339 TaxID=3156755 RepID=UPI0033A9B7AF